MAHAAEFKGRGLYQFKSDSGCPFAALALEGECNRIALDDIDTLATLDSASHIIRFTNTRAYGGKTVVADVLLQGNGRTRSGQRVPLTFHAVLSRSGRQWSVNSHAHSPVAGNFTEIVIDPYQVIVNDDDDKTQRVLLTPAQVARTVSSPSLAARLVNAFVQINDNRADASGNPDITVAFGWGRATAPMVRATFESMHQASDAKPSLDESLRSGNWSFQLQALSGRLPYDVVQRELFLYGLDTLPATQPLMHKRWPGYETLRVGAVNGRGFVAYGDRQQEFADVDHAARAFLQGSFVGLILGWQQQQQPQPSSPPR